MLQIPTSLCGSWRDGGRDKLPTICHVLGFLPTVQAPAARGGVHSWKGPSKMVGVTRGHQRADTLKP